MPCGLSSLVRGWYLCIRCVKFAAKMAEAVCLQCWECSHVYLSVDRRVGETAAPEGWCTPIVCALSRFHEVCGGTSDVYEWSRMRESLSGSLSVSSM
jgi:hypothetical protein